MKSDLINRFEDFLQKNLEMEVSKEWGIKEVKWAVDPNGCFLWKAFFKEDKAGFIYGTIPLNDLDFIEEIIEKDYHEWYETQIRAGIKKGVYDRFDLEIAEAIENGKKNNNLTHKRRNQ